MVGYVAPRFRAKTLRKLDVSDIVTLQTLDRHVDLGRAWTFREYMIELADLHGVHTVWLRSDRFSAFAYGNAIVTNPCNTADDLLTFAHECAHVRFHRTWTVPSHRREYEAENYSIAYLQSLGLTVTPQMIADGRSYVAWKIQMAVARGAQSIDRQAWQFADHADGFGHLRGRRRKYIQDFKGSLADVRRGNGFDDAVAALR